MYAGRRGSCATLMLANDVDARTVQEILGHRDVSTTLRFYGHVLPSMDGHIFGFP